jgi:hypothetical protein
MSAELERRLLALGAELEFPSTPDLVPGAIARLPARRSRRRAGRRLRIIAVAVAGVLVLAGAAMAVPTTRHAILRVLGLRGVRIERVTHFPPGAVQNGIRLGLGRPIPLADARHAAGFTALLPPTSATAYVAHDLPGGRVSLLAGRILIIEFRGTAFPFIFKLIGPGTRAQRVRVNGGPGIYLFGAPHELLFGTAGGIQPDRVRLAGNVLLWQQGQVTIRIEGTRTLAQALQAARSLR